jgi:hypothetical protein
MGVVVELRSKGVRGKVPGSERSTPAAGDIQAALRALARRCWAWEALPLARRIELLDEVIACTAAVAPGWVARECERKHVSWGSSVAGEEWWNGPWCALHAARRLRTELRRSEQDNRGAGWARVATVHRNETVSSIPFVETIETLFGEGRLVLLRLSTGNLAPVLDTALHPVIDEGFAFDPSAQGRFARFMRAHPDTELLGGGHPGSLPCGLITNLDPYSEDLAFTTDPFAPILSETSLQSCSTSDFIDGAIAFCNERVSGTLVATLVADPRSSRDPSTATALERGIEGLDYRMVTINLPPFVGLVYGHNGREAGPLGKTVIRGAFRSVIAPPWLVMHSHSDDVFRRLARYEAAPSAAQLPAIIWYSIRE